MKGDNNACTRGCCNVLLYVKLLKQCSVNPSNSCFYFSFAIYLPSLNLGLIYSLFLNLILFFLFLSLWVLVLGVHGPPSAPA